MSRRVLVALALFGGLALLLAGDLAVPGGVLGAAVLALLALLAGREYFAMWNKAGLAVAWLPWSAAAALCLPCVYLDGAERTGPLPPELWPAAAGLLAALVLLPRLAAPGRLSPCAATVLFLAAVGPGLAALLRLRQLEGGGPYALWLALGIAKLGDSAAYLGGAAFGRVRLAPRISPKKTVEGALAGLAAAGLLALGGGAAGILPFTASGCLLFGLLVGAAAQAGDLAESWVKRKAGVKDSGALFGQAGGWLDLLDSVLPVGAASCLLLAG